MQRFAMRSGPTEKHPARAVVRKAGDWVRYADVQDALLTVEAQDNAITELKAEVAEWTGKWRAVTENALTLNRALVAARAAADSNLIRLADADVLADEVAALVMRRALDARSPVADALLRYREDTRTDRSDRIVALETQLAAAQAALDGEHERALTEAAEELNKDPQDVMSGEDIAGYLRFRARAARRAAEAKGGERPLKISVIEHRDHTEHENNVHAEFARLRKELNDARDERDVARAALDGWREACGFYRQAHESCIDEFQHGTPAPVDRRCDDCIDYDARRAAEAKENAP